MSDELTPIAWVWVGDDVIRTGDVRGFAHDFDMAERSGEGRQVQVWAAGTGGLYLLAWSPIRSDFDDNDYATMTIYVHFPHGTESASYVVDGRS